MDREAGGITNMLGKCGEGNTNPPHCYERRVWECMNIRMRLWGRIGAA